MAFLRTSCRADLSGDARERFDIVARTCWQVRQTGSGVKSPQYRHRVKASMGEPHVTQAAPTGVPKPHH